MKIRKAKEVIKPKDRRQRKQQAEIKSKFEHILRKKLNGDDNSARL